MFIVNPYIYASGYLLDTYTAAAAYSLRQLKTGVTNVVRVRRSSDNAESDFTATDITDGTLTTWTGANDGFVTKWYDQSGNGLTQAQTNGTNQAQLVASGVLNTKGGLPCAIFSASNNFYFENSSVHATTNQSIASVSSSTATETVGAIISLHRTDGTFRTINQYLDSRTATNRNLNVRNTSAVSFNADLSTARVDTNQRLLIGIIDASKNMSSFDNGATGGTDTYTGSTLTGGSYLGRLNGGVNDLNGSLQEVIVFGSDISSDRTAIESDINTHYSIY